MSRMLGADGPTHLGWAAVRIATVAQSSCGNRHVGVGGCGQSPPVAVS
jgi:hypothetical protein